MAQPLAGTPDRSLARGLLWAVPVLVVLLLVPQVVDVYQVQLFTYALIFAIAALGFNLLLGYTGLLSFGHSAYFGLGAYTAAFMVKYLGIGSMELYILGGILITAAVSAIFGYICVRHTRIFFAILTLALSQVLWTLAYKFFWVTGGTDGLRVPFNGLTMLGGVLDFAGRGAYTSFVLSYYYYVLVLFIACVALMWLIVHSPFGKALQAIRDNETRAQFLGVRIIRYRWLAFLLSGSFTGLAGVLWVPLNGLVTPDILYWPFSGEIVFMTLLGGFRNFAGPIVGAVVYTYLETYAIATTQYWQFLLGFVLLILVMALPIGLVGAASRLVAYGRERWRGAGSGLATKDPERRGGAAT
jgi:branched-chain amino acid transport system permease protein